MVDLPEARHLLREVGMVEGLSFETVDEEIRLSLRVGECLQRRLAFFLGEMAERNLYIGQGYPTVEEYAFRKHGLSARRVRELLSLARQLRKLPEIDRAFCAHEITWVKAKQILRVAETDNQAAWIEEAKKMTLEGLTAYVKKHRRGQSPRQPGEMKGTPEPRWNLRLTLGPDAYEKEKLAREKLTAELGRSATPQDLFQAMLDLYLQFQCTGEVEGYHYVPSSLAKLTLRYGGCTSTPWWRTAATTRRSSSRWTGR